MKKCLTFILLGLIGIVFIWGIAASVLASDQTYPADKYTVSYAGIYNLNKDGKVLVNTDVAAGMEYLQIKSTSIEVISEKEWQTRTVKNKKIIMIKAKQNADTVQADSTKTDNQKFSAKLTYENTRSDYEKHQRKLKLLESSAVQAGANAFFGIYFPVIILLSILLLINHKTQKQHNT